VDNRHDLQRLLVFLGILGVLHAGFGVLDALLYHLGLKDWITAAYDFIGRGYANRFGEFYRVGGLQFTPENLGLMLGYFLPFVLLATTLCSSRRGWWLLGLGWMGSPF